MIVNRRNMRWNMRAEDAKWLLHINEMNVKRTAENRDGVEKKKLCAQLTKMWNHKTNNYVFVCWRLLAQKYIGEKIENPIASILFCFIQKTTFSIGINVTTFWLPKREWEQEIEKAPVGSWKLPPTSNQFGKSNYANIRFSKNIWRRMTGSRITDSNSKWV